MQIPDTDIVIMKLFMVQYSKLSEDQVLTRIHSCCSIASIEDANLRRLEILVPNYNG